MADPTKEPFSDVPLGLPQEPNEAREAFIQRINEADAKEKKRIEESPFRLLEGKKYPAYECFIDHDEHDNPLGFKAGLLADWLSKNEKFKTDINTGILYFFDGASWVANAEPYLETICATILGKENRQSAFNNVLHDLKGLTYCYIKFSKKLAVLNGLLDVETQTLTEYNAEEMPFHSIPIKYDAEAKCPSWEAFISLVVNADDLRTIQEWSGFLLLPDYRFHKLLWIHGEGRNGKGVWQRTMEAILGEKNISSVGLEEFDGNHRFALRQLYGKLFNPCSEPPTNRTLQTPLLKKATGQDTIEAEIKGKQARLSFRNCAKITVLANKFPKVNDNSIAFRERRLFIKFPNEYTGANQIQNIEDNWLKVQDERSGILNWMLQGLKRLLEQGHFTESLTQQETEAEFLRASDTISAFLTELAIFGKNLVVSRSEAFDSYKNYCDVFGLDAENEKKFTQRMKDTPKISPTTISKPKRERAWKGISFKHLNDDGTVTPVTDVTPLYTGLISDNQKIKQDQLPVTTVTPVTSSKSQYVCDKCGLEYPALTPDGLCNGSYENGVCKGKIGLKSENSPLENTVHFQRVNPFFESHKCDICKALLAEFKQKISVEDQKRLKLNQSAIYLCKDCFGKSKANAESEGAVLVEVPMDEQPINYEEREAS